MTQKIVVGDEGLSGAPLPTVAKPFDPVGNVKLSASDESARVELPPVGTTMIVRNYGPAQVCIRRGDADVEADLTDYPVEAETYDYILRDVEAHSHLAAICAQGETAELTINCGEGGG